MRKRFLVLMLTFVSVLAAVATFIPNVQGNPASTVVSGIPAGMYPTPLRHQRHGFEAQTRQWVFYHNSSLRYKSSVNGIAWSSEGTVPDLSMQSTVWHNDTHVFITSYYQVEKYILGRLYSNGTISFESSVTVSFGGESKWYSYVSVDADGYPWIIVANGTIESSMDTSVRKATDKNGQTWGSPTVLSTFKAERYGPVILPFSNGDMYAIYKAYDSPTETRDRYYGRYYNRTTTTWQSQENITAGNMGGTTLFSALIDSTDKVWLIYVNTTDQSLCYATRVSSWSSPQILDSSLGDYPEIAATVSGNNIYVFYSPHPTWKVYAVAYINGQWKPKFHVTTITNGHATQTAMSSYYKKTEKTIGLIWGEYTTTTAVMFESVKLKFNVKVLDRKNMAVLTGAAVTINNGTLSEVSASSGWANFTGIDIDSVLSGITATLQGVTVNTTSTTVNLNWTTNMELVSDVYSLTVKIQTQGGIPYADVPLELWRDNTLLNGAYGLSAEPKTNSSGYYVWSQLAQQASSYMVRSTSAGISPITVSLTGDTSGTLVVQEPSVPSTEKKKEPTAPQIGLPGGITLTREQVFAILLIASLLCIIAYRERH